MAEFLVTSSLDSVEKGQEFEGSLPRHITVLQWFTLPYERAFVNALENYATRVAAFEVTAGDEALFGPNNDVPVRTIRRVGRLAAIHTDIVAMVAQQGGDIRSPQWMGDNYRPHVTYVDGRALEKGEVATIDRLELIRRDDGEKLKTVVSALRMTGKRS